MWPGVSTMLTLHLCHWKEVTAAWMVIPRCRSKNMVSVLVVPFRRSPVLKWLRWHIAGSPSRSSFQRLHGQEFQYWLFSCDCPPFTAPKGIKSPAVKYFTTGDYKLRTYTYTAYTCLWVLFWGYVKIDKAKVFLNWVQKLSPYKRDYHNPLFPLFDYSFI